MPAIKNFLDSKAASIPSEIFECLTLYKNNQQKIISHTNLLNWKTIDDKTYF